MSQTDRNGASTSPTAPPSILTWRGAWGTGVTYVAYDLAYINGSTYICITGHVSGVFSTDLAAGKWAIFAASTGGDLLAANNLNDVANKATSRTNLAVPGVATPNTFTARQNLAAFNVAANPTTTDIWTGGNVATLTGGAVTFTNFAAAPQAGVTARVNLNAAHTFTNNANLTITGGTWTGANNGWVDVYAITTTTFLVTPHNADGTAVVASTSILVKTRQTILQQAAAPLVIGTGLAVNLAATATSYRVTVPNGVGANGNIDFMVNRTADVTGYWSGLTASVINYLFVDRNSSTGVDTGVASSLPYIAQAGGTISVVSGQHTYDYSTGTMYVGNGSVATAVQRTAVGQCLAGAASITTVTPYAIGRIYDSGYTATLPIVAARTTKVSNLGVEGEHELTIKCTTADLNFAVGETLSWRSGGGWNGAFIQPGVGSSRLEVWMALGTGNSFAPIPGAGGTSGTLLTPASWSYKLTHKTPWN